MDEQNPRLTAERVGGRGDDTVTGYAVAERPSAPVSDPWEAERLRPDFGNDDTEAASGTRATELRTEIAQTRDQMSETVNAIQDRLRPANIASEAADSVKRAARNTVQEVGDSEPVAYARANPVPSIMVAVGIAGATWLAMAGRDGGQVRRRRASFGSREWRPGMRADYDDRPYDGGGAHGGYQTAAAYNPDLSGPTGAPSTDYAQPGTIGARHWSRSETDGGAMSRVLPDRQTLQETWDHSPLLIGAVAALAGALVGLSVPASRKEHELMGETRDALVEKVQDTVREKVDQVQQTASDAVTKVQNLAGLAGGSPTPSPNTGS